MMQFLEEMDIPDDLKAKIEVNLKVRMLLKDVKKLPKVEANYHSDLSRLTMKQRKERLLEQKRRASKKWRLAHLEYSRQYQRAHQRIYRENQKKLKAKGADTP